MQSLFFTWQLRSGLPSQQCLAVCTPRFVFAHMKDGKDRKHLEQMFVALESSSSAINACIYNIPRRSTTYFCNKLITIITSSSSRELKPSPPSLPGSSKVLSPPNSPRLSHHLASWPAVDIDLVITIMTYGHLECCYKFNITWWSVGTVSFFWMIVVVVTT